MNKLYEVTPTDSAEDAKIYATHAWELPGVQCPSCGSVWGASGVVYPSIDLSDLPNQDRFIEPWPVPLEEFNKLKTFLLTRFPHLRYLPPGTDFGPLLGSATGVFDDFAWRDPWTLLMQPETSKKLASLGLRLPRCVPARLKITHCNVRQLCELELELQTRIVFSAFSSGIHRCSACGRVADDLPEPILIRHSSVPEEIDIFRDSVFPTVILAKLAFVQAVERLGLTGISFREVQLV